MMQSSAQGPRINGVTRGNIRRRAGHLWGEEVEFSSSPAFWAALANIPLVNRTGLLRRQVVAQTPEC